MLWLVAGGGILVSGLGPPWHGPDQPQCGHSPRLARVQRVSLTFWHQTVACSDICHSYNSPSLVLRNDNNRFCWLVDKQQAFASFRCISAFQDKTIFYPKTHDITLLIFIVDTNFIKQPRMPGSRSRFTLPVLNWPQSMSQHRKYWIPTIISNNNANRAAKMPS